MTNKKLNFYTEPDGNRWVGRCKEYPKIIFTTRTIVEGGSRSQALHGVKRMVAHLEAKVPKHVKKGLKIKAPVAKKQETRIAYVIDRSGSMSHIFNDVKSAFAADIKTILNSGQNSFISTLLFNDIVITTISHQPPAFVTGINVTHPNGGTALMDAVVAAVKELESVPVMFDTEVAYLVCVLTDGEENASRHINEFNFKALLQQKQSEGNWTFTMLVPPGYRNQTSNRFGLPLGNIREWEATSQGVSQYQAANAVGLTGYLDNRSRGVLRSSTFYADAGNLTNAKAKAKLTDIQGHVKVFEVKQVGEIKPVCEQVMKQPYRQGHAFYQLTKPEKVQYHKKILIRHNKNGAVYAGDAARQLLNLPMAGDARVAPGVNGEFTVFVQSTSTNRKLYPGSNVVYFTGSIAGI